MIASLVANRYTVSSVLGEGGMGTVYAAYDRLTQENVAYKQIRQAAVGVDNTPARVALAREFQILASLKHPHIISVIDYGFINQDEPFFTMSLLENPKNVVDYTSKLSLPDRVEILLQMLQALAYLHRRGIIHRDLKPDNALVTADGVVRLLDFGISTPDRQKQGEEASVSGTLAYIAPEVLRGEPITRRSDLYSLGIIAYELLTGAHPFDTKHMGTLISQILNTSPDISALEISIIKTHQTTQAELSDMAHEDEKLGLDFGFDDDDGPKTGTGTKPLKEQLVEQFGSSVTDDSPIGLALIVNRLLDKEPENRYSTADEVIEAMCAMLKRPLPNEVDIRESYLQAAKFVGRDAEIMQLDASLQKTVTDKRGDAVLIGGEAGVGKSRLLNELRISAMVHGAIVLSGQGVAGGGLHYQFWRNPLRRLAISVELTDIEASILKSVVPDIGQLIGRTVEDAPELGETGKDRLVNTIVSVFKRVQQPILLILEDLQWGTESLDVLRALIPLTQEMPLLIVGSYRADESPDLPQTLAEMTLLMLDRLEDSAIEELSVSMLGDVGHKPEVIDLLKRETEGNVFFLVEVVRALAEQAGRLNQIGTTALPDKVFAGGIQQIVEQRLARVTHPSHLLLKVAAVVGRQIDLKLMHYMIPKADLDAWLTECSNAAVLDVMDGQWYFAHEKLREGLVASISQVDQSKLHLRVAKALENFYSDRPDYAMLISEHYEQADAVDDAARFYVAAGNYAKQTYVAAPATAYFEKAINYWKTHPAALEKTSIDDQISTYTGLGIMYFWQARYDESIQIFETLKELAIQHGKKSAQSRALSGIANIALYQGDMAKSLELLTEAEALAREADDDLQLAQILWVRGVTMYYMGNFQEVLSIGGQLQTIAEKTAQKNLQGQGLNIMGAVYYGLGDYIRAARNFENAHTILESIGDHGPAVSALNNVGQVAEARGDYDKALTSYTEALRQIRAIGIRDAEMLYLSNLGGVQVKLQDYDEAQRNLKRVIEMAATSPFGQLSETYRFLAEALLAKKRLDEAVPAAQQSMALANAAGAPEMQANSWRVLGQVASVLEKAIAVTPDGTATYDAVACFAESIRICKENGMEGDRARTLREMARHEVRNFQIERSDELWQQARDLFGEVGADLEVQRMGDLPSA